MLKSSERRNEDAETKGGKTKKTHRLKRREQEHKAKAEGKRGRELSTHLTRA